MVNTTCYNLINETNTDLIIEFKGTGTVETIKPSEAINVPKFNSSPINIKTILDSDSKEYGAVDLTYNDYYGRVMISNTGNLICSIDHIHDTITVTERK